MVVFVTHGVAMGWYVDGPLALKSVMSFFPEWIAHSSKIQSPAQEV